MADKEPYDIATAHQELNLTKYIDEDKLKEIGNELVSLIDEDLDSRKDWEEKNDRWLTLATQVISPKSTPWPNASNIKFPVLNTAAVQFHSRAYASLLNNKDLVKPKIIGKDKDGSKTQVGNRIASYMSIQINDLMPDWHEEMDRLLFLLPVIGLVYKKTYFDPIDAKKYSIMIHPRDVIINYAARDYKSARMTHRYSLPENIVIEYINAGLFDDIELDKDSPEEMKREGPEDTIQGLTPPASNGSKEYGSHDHLFYEVHTELDLDEDGYKEPYIVYIKKSTHEVARIVARWDRPEDIKQDEDGNLIKIVPTNYFTAYQFMPDPESKVYAIGFGILLGPSNEAINTIINLLVDAGVLSNIQGGFIGKGARTPGGSFGFTPGKWTMLPIHAEDLRKVIYPLPVKEPSSTLFQLLGLLIQGSKDLASIQDVMVGKSPGQNTPFSTTEAVLEQGIKVFNGIYKRVYRSFTEELKKLYRLNSLYPDDEMYQTILDEPVKMSEDFSLENLDVIPSAEPDMVQEAQKIVKANGLLVKLREGLPLNPTVVTRMILEAENQENIKELMTVQPQPDPKIELEKQKLQMEAQDRMIERQLEATKIRAQAIRDNASAISTLRQLDIKLSEQQQKEVQQHLDQINKERELALKELEIITKEMESRRKAKQETKEPKET
jgi:chaperonin GroES